jgi:multifunctional beta-oxidation protein
LVFQHYINIFNRQIVGNFGNAEEDGPSIDTKDDIVTKAKKLKEVVEYKYTERDVILYNLGVGATEQELKWTFEGHDDFAALPTFGVIPQFPASGGLSLDFLPNFNPVGHCHRRLT